MRHLVKSAVAIPLSAAGALGLVSSTATAAPTGSTSLYAPSALVLTTGEGDSAATAAPLRAVTLSCSPQPAGTHPEPHAACAELDAAGGNFAALADTAADGTFCPMVHDPVVVTATGVWEGRRVHFAHTYGNDCLKAAQDATVFAF